jgi:two-component system, NarL family, sensor histidine kinase UhpB
MSLRARVIGLVALVLLVSVAIYVAIAWTGARSDLAAEIDAARKGGSLTVRSAFEDLPRSDHPARDLRQLVATFDGNRHLRASVIDRLRHVRISSEVAMPRHAAPGWFSAAVSPDIEPTIVSVPDGSGDVLELQPEPASDVAAIWHASLNAIMVFAIAALLGLGLVYFVIGRALAPLADLSRGFSAIGAGGAGRERVRETGPRELLILQRGFNAMSERLDDIDARNRALEAQLLTIQDEERAEVARDLHDEIGPHLFAVALDAEMIGRGLDGDTRLVREHLRSIHTAVSYMQRQVRDLIARLRPTRAAELGLEAAFGDLVAFWQSRQPEVVFTTAVEGADSFVPEPLRDVIYRVVQESVANALRHAETRELLIGVFSRGGGVAVKVANVGAARQAVQGTPGLGLFSMRERVHAAGGVLQIERAPQGWTVSARFGLLTEEAAA